MDGEAIRREAVRQKREEDAKARAAEVGAVPLVVVQDKGGLETHCKFCGGELRKKRVGTDGGVGCLVILIGVAVVVAGFGARGALVSDVTVVVGGLTLVYGLVVANRTKIVWKCAKCRVVAS